MIWFHFLKRNNIVSIIETKWSFHMGRPPIGKVAMTAAERLRRHRLKHRQEKKPGENDALARAHARIAEVERERDHYKHELRQAKRAEPATKPEPDRRDEENARLKARIAELESGGEQEKLKARNAELEAALKKADRAFIWTAKQYRDIEFCTHPDRVAHLKDEGLTARFNAAFRTVKASKGILVDKDTEEVDTEDLERWSERFRKRDAREAERQAKAQARYDARSTAARKAARKRAAQKQRD
jgi:hypothetical protein